MRRILFVDDEPRILEGLQRMLRSQRRMWNMSFASGGQAALAELEASRFDVIVTDMRMPGIDGATLLTRVQEQSPETVRIVLSGQMDPDAAARAVRVAHQFLSKPCSAEVLQEVVERACNLRDLLNDERIRRTVGQVDALPAVPRLYTALVETLARPDATADEVAGVLEQDVAMAAKILHLVNSSFFGLSRHVTHLRTAVSLLGTNMIKSLVLSTEAFRAFEGSSAPGGFSVDALHRHSLSVANLAMRLLEDRKLAEDVYVAGMLHDVGKLVLADRLPEEFRQVVTTARERGLPAEVVEQELLGVTHGEIGAYLLGLWNLPYPIVEAVAYHHAPRRVGHDTFDLLTAVHVADALAHEAEPNGVGAGVTHGCVDEAHLQAIGVLDRLPTWREIAREQHHGAREEA